MTVDGECNTRLAFWASVTGLLNVTDLAHGTGFEGVKVTSDLAVALPTLLLNGFESLPHPLTLVIDSYQRIADPAVEADLLRLVRHTANLNLVVGTREPTALGSTSTILSVDAVVIGVRALTFTSDEVGQLAAYLNRPLAAEEIQALHVASSGWPLAVRAGVQTSSEHPWPSADEIDVVSRVQRMLVGNLHDVAGFDQLVVTSVVESFSVRQDLARPKGNSLIWQSSSAVTGF